MTNLLYIIDLDTRDVLTGRVMKDIHRWVRPIASRVHVAALEQKRQTVKEVDDWSRELGADLFKEGQRSGEGAPIVAKKFIKPTVNQVRSGRGEIEVGSTLIPPPPPGGFEKYLRKDEGDPGDLGNVGAA